MNAIDRLELFVAKARELQETRLLQRQFQVGMTISWRQMEAVQFESREPNEDELRAFLLPFRQFVAPREVIGLNRIYNLARTVVRSETLKGHLIEARQAWKQAFKKGGFTLVFDDRNITPELVYDLWINGHYFHSDPDKRRELLSLIGPERVFARQLFLDLLVEGTKQVLYTANVLLVALREGQVEAEVNGA